MLAALYAGATRTPRLRSHVALSLERRARARGRRGSAAGALAALTRRAFLFAPLATPVLVLLGLMIAWNIFNSIYSESVTASATHNVRTRATRACRKPCARRTAHHARVGARSATTTTRASTSTACAGSKLRRPPRCLQTAACRRWRRSAISAALSPLTTRMGRSTLAAHHENGRTTSQ